MFGRGRKEERKSQSADETQWYLVLRNDLGREMRREGPVKGAAAVVEWMRLWEGEWHLEASAERVSPEPVVVVEAVKEWDW